MIDRDQREWLAELRKFIGPHRWSSAIDAALVTIDAQAEELALLRAIAVVLHNWGTADELLDEWRAKYGGAKS